MLDSLGMYYCVILVKVHCILRTSLYTDTILGMHFDSTYRLGFPRWAAAGDTFSGIKNIGNNVNLEYQCWVGNSVCIYIIQYLKCKFSAPSSFTLILCLSMYIEPRGEIFLKKNARYLHIV